MTNKITIIRVLLQVGILCIAGIVFLTGSTYPNESLVFHKANESTITVNGVVIHKQYDPAFFPEGWLSAPINCHGKQVEAVDAQRVTPIIEQFLSSYHANVIESNLTDIYLLSELICFGKPYGGTNATTDIYINVGSQQGGYTDQFLLSLLHAEFSSILMRYHPFPAESWMAVNDDNFVYPNNAVDILEQKGLQEPSPELLAAGFLDHYATASVEEDFNEFSSWLFMRHQELCNICAEYPKIAEKHELAVEFYTSVDPDMQWLACK